MCVCVRTHFSSYPKGAVGHIDLSPGDDDGVFDGLDWSVHTQVSAIAFVCNFNVDGAAFSILSRSKSMSTHNAFTSQSKYFREGRSPHLCINGEVTFPCHAGINGEFSRLVHNDAGGFQAGTVRFHLRRYITFINVTKPVIIKYSEVTFSGKVSLAAGRM